MIREIQELYAYHRWANHRILDAAGSRPGAELTRDLGSSYPSMLATLTHMLAAEWVWSERWNGRSPSSVPADWRLDELPGVREHWRAVESAQARFVDGLAERDLERVVDYRNTQGQSFSTPLGVVLRHVVNHASYHRGQVVTMLRQLGASPPSTDLVLHHREVLAPASR